MTTYVWMTDTFMSGWGPAKGKTNIYCIECDNDDQAKIVKANAQKRSEMRGIHMTDYPPQQTSDRIISHKHFSELGPIWTEAS